MRVSRVLWIASLLSLDLGCQKDGTPKPSAPATARALPPSRTIALEGARHWLLAFRQGTTEAMDTLSRFPLTLSMEGLDARSRCRGGNFSISPPLRSALRCVREDAKIQGFFGRKPDQRVLEVEEADPFRWDHVRWPDAWKSDHKLVEFTFRTNAEATEYIQGLMALRYVEPQQGRVDAVDLEYVAE